MNYSNYDFEDICHDDVVIYDHVSLGERRLENTIHLPESATLEEMEFDALDLASMFSNIDDILEEIPGVKETSKPSIILGAEVGDDRVDVTNDPLLAALELVFQETVLGMRTSKEDTGITKDLWNFCEVTTGLPCSKGTMYNYARRNSDFTKLAFVDSPPIRVVIDTTKIDRVHSTSYKGKVKVLGAKLRSSNAICTGYLDVANLFQDALLAVWKGSDPKYLPTTLGGCGCPDMYSDPYNTYLSMKSFRGGGYDRLYGTAVEESKVVIAENERGLPSYAIISEILRDNDELAFATFANYVAVPDLEEIAPDPDMPTPLYKRAGVRNEVTSVEGRLVNAKRLVTKPQAQVEWARTKRIQDYIFSGKDILLSEDLSKCKRAQRRGKLYGALRGNTAFMNLLERKGSNKDIMDLLSQRWQTVSFGQSEFTVEHANWLSRGAKGETLNIYDIPSSYDMFVRKEVSLEESLKVGGINLRVQGASDWMPQKTVAKVGLYEITKPMEQWCDDKIDALIAIKADKGRPLHRHELMPIFTEDREWVNDDTSLIQMCIDITREMPPHSQVCLISNDRRLANQMSHQTNTVVILVDPACLPRVFPEKVWNEASKLTALEVFMKYPKNRFSYGYLKIPVAVLIDTGSVSSALSRLEVDDSSGVTKFFERRYTVCGLTPSGHRFDEYEKRELHFESYLTISKSFDPDRRNHRRRKRHPLSRDSGSASRYSYSSSNTSASFQPRMTRRKARIMRDA